MNRTAGHGDPKRIPSLVPYLGSRVEGDGTQYWLARGPQGKALIVVGDVSTFEGDALPAGVGKREGMVCPLTARNAAVLRGRLPWLRPQTLGLKRSAGCGDRLGLATPGHIRAIRSVGDPPGPRRDCTPGQLRDCTDTFAFAPILAQQSMRENARTGRSPQAVLDDAMWGVFQEGWRHPWGADADHLKTAADVDLCAAAGYTFYTVDPGDHVDNEAHTAPMDALVQKVRALPWDRLEDSPEGLHERYLGRQFAAEDLLLEFEPPSLARAAAKYGRAVAHTAALYRHLAEVMASQPFELEVSVDETETPTSPLEHFFVASELKRLGVRWVSLAPRYVGRFEKGVDYIGDLAVFDDTVAKHAAIARILGPYKLSIHSGSDKFGVYPVFARHAGERVHLKTAGTSYLEALRALAPVEPGLFRDLLRLARARYAEDRATYHVSAEVSRVPTPEDLADEDLAAVLDLFDGREVLHVTFGSVLDRFGGRLVAALDAHEEAHYAALQAHFERHLSAFL